MSDKTHKCGGCGGCGADSGHGHTSPASSKDPANPLSQIKTVIGVMSGKGGTGKSLVCGLLAVELSKKGKKVAILDADIGSGIISELFPIPQGVTRGDVGLYPAITEGGIKVMGIDLLLEEGADAVTWRGPIMAGIVSQFWSDVIWDEIDCLLIDFPPGNGDVAQMVLERLPLDGVILITTPQETANAKVARTARMVQGMCIPVLGIVENLCNLFGERKPTHGLPMLDRIPLDLRLAEAANTGGLEEIETDYLVNTVAVIAAI